MASAESGPLQGATITLSLRGILRPLPAEFLARGVERPLAGVEVTLLLAELLPQLSSGKVHITLGKLRRVVPAGVIATTPSAADDTLIELPLSEVLDRLNPAHLMPSAESVPAPNPQAQGEAGTIPLPPGGEIVPEIAPRFTPPLQEAGTWPKLPPTRQEMLARQAASESPTEAENPAAPARIALL